MTFASFVTIQSQLLLARVPAIHSLNINIWIFATTFVLLYGPPGMIIGYWHRKNQFSVQQEALFSQNQIDATINLFLMDLIDGQVSEEKKQQMRRYLLKIMKRSDRALMGASHTRAQPEVKSEINLETNQSKKSNQYAC